MVGVSRWIVLVGMGIVNTGCGGFRAQSQVTALTEMSGSPPARTGLLDNPGFESGLLGWEDWGASALSKSARSGDFALSLTGAGGRGQEVIHRLKTGATYELSAYARRTDPSDQVHLGVRFFNAGNATMGGEHVAVTTSSYGLHTVRFQLPPSVSSAKVYLTKQSDSSAPAEADDFTLTLVAAAAAPPGLPAVSNPEGVQPSGGGGGWTLVFEDQFDGPLDSAVWNTGFWFNYNLDNQVQAYRPENVSSGDGMLALTAERRPTQTTWGDPAAYASGAVTTRGKFTFTFGALEARVRAARGSGLMAQVWLLPAGKRSPPQIELLNLLGQNTALARMSYQWLDGSGMPQALQLSAAAGDLSVAFHTVTLLWLPDELRYLIDGRPVGAYTGEFVLRDPAFLLLNLALGGEAAGPVGATVFPQRFEVDYVRVWQRPL